MNLHIVDAGLFKLDGGAMFGVVPQTLWKPLAPPDASNRCTWSMRCLLIEEGDRRILIDNGIGDKQDATFLSRFAVEAPRRLLQSLRKLGLDAGDITDVFLTHLHFDHCGGGVENHGEGYRLTFPNARYWTNKEHWHWATQPNARERASFLRENLLPMQESGHLHFIEEGAPLPLPFEILYASGHTEKMMIPKISYKGHTLCFMADLLPSAAHIPLPYVMAYDIRPLQTLEEKQAFLHEAAAQQYVLLLEHDPVNECCTVKRTEKGIVLDHTLPLGEIL